LHTVGISLVFIISVLIAGFLTLIEFSLLRLKRTRIKELIEHKTDEDWLQIWIKRAERFWLTSLVVGTIVRVTAGISIYVLLINRFNLYELHSIVLAIAISSFIIVILTEIIPRAIGRAFGEKCARYLLTPMHVFSFLVSPVTFPFMALIRLAGRFLKVGESLNPIADFEKDIMEILETGDKSIVLEEDEKELISSVVEFTDTIVREVMVPRVDITAVEETATLREVYRKIMETGHTRIPVYRGNIDSVVGIFNAKDLLKYVDRKEIDTQRVTEEMHDPIFVPETKNIDDLLREFQQKKINVAIVVDEFGGTAGLVTIKNLLEEIVGEIKDEDDREKTMYAEMPDGAYVVDAKMTIDEINTAIGITVPESAEYETIGGYIYNVLGKIPLKDEIFQRDGIVIKILEADDRRIRKVVLKKSDSRREIK
jgi:putative hemolysin